MNLIEVYNNRGILAKDVPIGMKLKVLERYGRGCNIPVGTIGTVTESTRCVYLTCTPNIRHLCKGYILSVKVEPDLMAHSCNFKFSTLSNIPIIFEEG